MPSVVTLAADSAAPTSAACPAISVFAAFLVTQCARRARDDAARAWTARGRDENAVDGGGGGVPLPKDTFDFIVVGGGSAGCVLAARLSEVPAWRVLLLEAGLEEPPEAQVPATYRNLQMTGMNWGYQSEPEPGHCNGTGCPCPKGRVLGGTGAINGFVYIRGSPRDYDEWAAVLKDDGWSYSGVLPFFLRSENALDEDLAADTEHHATGGPLAVSRLASRDPVNDVLVEAMKNIGLVEGDPNGASQLGYSASQVTVAGGERMSANRAFLEPARNRSNLEVRTGVHVTRVLFVGAEAVGVEFRDREGVSSRAYAAREVVLTAGVMNTPQILMLSGVGPKEHLAALGIEVVADLPAVGENLMNHVTALGVQYLLPPGWRPGPGGADVSRRVEDFAHFVPGGPLSSLGPEEVNAFCKLDAVSPGGTPTAATAATDRPDINLRFYGLVPKSASTSDPDCAPTPVADPVYYDRLLVTPVVLPTRSSGRVRLRSADPLAAPSIALNLLGDDADLALLVRGLGLAASLEETAAFRGAGLVLDRTPMPGCEAHPFGGDGYWGCVARAHTLNTFHTAGTARMAAAAADDGVLDPQLRVRGVARLRVADAAAMPLLPSGNTNAPVIMVAERAADLVRRAWP